MSGRDFYLRPTRIGPRLASSRVKRTAGRHFKPRRGSPRTLARSRLRTGSLQRIRGARTRAVTGARIGTQVSKGVSTSDGTRYEQNNGPLQQLVQEQGGQATGPDLQPEVHREAAGEDGGEVREGGEGAQGQGTFRTPGCSGAKFQPGAKVEGAGALSTSTTLNRSPHSRRR